ncbi:MAG: HepT-like ribonuclease domain-containing protein [Planctomycetota bacterium]
MRNRLVHAYFDINLDVLWQTVQNDLPVLAQALENNIPKGKP